MEFLFVEYSIFNILIKYLTDKDFSSLFHVSQILKKISSKVLTKRNPWILTDLKLQETCNDFIEIEDCNYSTYRLYHYVNSIGLRYGHFLHNQQLFMILRSFYCTERVFSLKQRLTNLPIFKFEHTKLPNFLTRKQKQQSFLLISTDDIKYTFDLNKLNLNSLIKFETKDFLKSSSRFSSLLVPDCFCQLLSNMDSLVINDIKVPDIIQKGNSFFPDQKKRFFVTNHDEGTLTFTIFKVELQDKRLIILQNIKIPKIWKPYDLIKNHSYYVYQDYLQLRIYNLETKQKSILDKNGASSLIYFDPFSKFVGLFTFNDSRLQILNLETQKIHQVIQCNLFWNYVYTNKTLFISDQNYDIHEIKINI